MHLDKLGIAIEWHSDQKYIGTAVCIQLNPPIIASINCVPRHTNSEDDVWFKDADDRWRGRSGNFPNSAFMEALDAAEQYFIDTLEKLETIILTDSTDSTSS